ncbi:MAG: DUF5678 domain-containing protein [Blastocatellia bacterium]
MAMSYEEIREQIRQLSAAERDRLLSDLRDGLSSGPPAAGAGAPVDFSREQEWLSAHQDQFRGRHVAVSGDRLIAQGDDFKKVMDEIREAGVEHYLLSWIEPEGTVYGGGVHL